MNTWIEDYCPSCKSANFINNGDVSDLTGMDVEGFICWKCKKKIAISEDGDELTVSDDDNLYFKEGVDMQPVKSKSRK